jgi:hypothetical protein
MLYLGEDYTFSLVFQVCKNSGLEGYTTHPLNAVATHVRDCSRTTHASMCATHAHPTTHASMCATHAHTHNARLHVRAHDHAYILNKFVADKWHPYQ